MKREERSHNQKPGSPHLPPPKDHLPSFDSNRIEEETDVEEYPTAPEQEEMYQDYIKLQNRIGSLKDQIHKNARYRGVRGKQNDREYQDGAAVIDRQKKRLDKKQENVDLLARLIDEFSDKTSKKKTARGQKENTRPPSKSQNTDLLLSAEAHDSKSPLQNEDLQEKQRGVDSDGPYEEQKSNEQISKFEVSYQEQGNDDNIADCNEIQRVKSE